MTPLERARQRLTLRFLRLDAIVEVEHPVGPEWDAYVATVALLEKLTHETTPTTPLLTTKELAERMGLHPRTVLRRRDRSEIAPVAGTKGKGKRLRWAAP